LPLSDHKPTTKNHASKVSLHQITMPSFQYSDTKTVITNNAKKISDRASGFYPYTWQAQLASSEKRGKFW